VYVIFKGELKRSRPIFLVVGTDTDVGKTVFSGLLGKYLKGRGVGIRLAKPFCSGGKGDVEFLQACSAHGQAEVNYWYDNEPISPASWELRSGEKVDFEAIVSWLKEGFQSLAEDVLLVEGVGGLLAPITSKHKVASIAQELGSKLIIIAQNRVGVLNHVLLTVDAALSRGLSIACVILMRQEEPDASSADNAELICMHIPNIPDFKGVFEFPWLGRDASNINLIPNNVKKADSVLEKIFDKVFKPYFINVLRN